MKRREREQAELAEAMRAKRLTSDALAASLGYHPVVIRQWMSGAKPMSSRARRVVRTLLPQIPAASDV
jgi:hypothetical protein